MKKPLAALTVLVFLAGLFLLLLPATTESAAPVRRPTPTPAAPPPSRAPVSPQLLCPNCPDLIVRSITTDPRVPTAGVTATIEVVIANIGVADVPDGYNYYVDLYVNPAEPPIAFLPGDFAWGVQSWYLPAGGFWVLTTTYRFMDTNTYALFAQIDTDNSITETNELNNVLGPMGINVQSSAFFQQSTHQDFQYGQASGLDLSHPDGVVTLGHFDQPWQDAGITATSVYSPDTMINDVIASYSGGSLLPTTVEQVRPSIVTDQDENIYTVWQDARHGGTYNNRIYFSRSTDGGVTWSPNVSLTADIPVTTVVNQLAPRIAFDNITGQAAVVWQDNRRGHYDIYFSGSSDGGVTWSPGVRVNDDAVNPAAHKLHPSLVISDGGAIYVAWQDQRNGNDDIYFSRSNDSGATWLQPNTFVTDDPETTLQAQRSPSIGLGAGNRVYVVWEDWRDPLHPEIYVSDSIDNGLSFDIDIPVEYPAGQSYRVAPTLVIWPATTVYTTVEEILGFRFLVVRTAFVDVIHVAWQEGQDENADIYYTYAWFSYNQQALANQACPVWAYEYCFQPKIRVNGNFIDYDYAQPPEGKTRWPLAPTWQGEVAMTKAYNLTWCPSDSDPKPTYHEGVYITWSDSRGFDRDRRDLFVARIAHPHSPNDSITSHVLVCNQNEVLNDNAKLYNYRDDPAMWALTKPANVRQSNPSIAVTPYVGVVTYTVNSIIYVGGVPTLITDTFTTTMPLDAERIRVLAWDDDRWDTPLMPGTRRNRDIFFTKSQETYYGVYISPVFDTKSPLTTWYNLDWFGTTSYGTSTYFQTRTGNTPIPPKENAAVSTWTVFTGTQPIQMVNGPTDPIFVNDAPGQPIVSPPGRYIQYKLIIDGGRQRFDEWERLETAVTRVTIHYENKMVPVAFLPLVMSNFTEPVRR